MGSEAMLHVHLWHATCVSSFQPPGKPTTVSMACRQGNTLSEFSVWHEPCTVAARPWTLAARRHALAVTLCAAWGEVDEHSLSKGAVIWRDERRGLWTHGCSFVSKFCRSCFLYVREEPLWTPSFSGKADLWGFSQIFQQVNNVESWTLSGEEMNKQAFEVKPTKSVEL